MGFRAELTDMLTSNGVGLKIATRAGLVLGAVVAAGVARAIVAAAKPVVDEEWARVLDRGDWPGPGHHPAEHGPPAAGGRGPSTAQKPAVAVR